MIKHCSITDNPEVMVKDHVLLSGHVMKMDRRIARLIEEGFTGRGITIAILDSGVDHNHPQLRGRVRGDVEDPLGHGTLGGTLAAGAEVYVNPDGWDLEGTPKVRGGAPDATILSIRVLDETGGGTPQQLADGIYRAVEEGADIINISAGQSSCSIFNDVVRDAVAYAHGKHVLVLAATGNDGGMGTIACPAKHPETIAVGSINRKGELSDFASRSYGQFHADIYFLGGDGDPLEWIYSGTSFDSPFDNTWPDTGRGYAARRGTSLSCFIASGYAALLLQAYKNPQDVFDILKGEKEVRI